ncbi:molybdopterin-guanine dinucleotide biosynthesis protein B [Dehalogenimonas etheniformans]|uniref:Molybdopterin-guanine dinucleotide biosynthesis protein B n=1 Tax=Dehalogenimonas etheniformans TaxID=1536648 RepID=A0A2P5P9Z2_9CHLR|nr:molybdopterin-guanine dinucleotide biosynthesis protein B [Dehalogenimonas etheniformans]PPD59111.1 molybdopterin-guanine dinucleotide biosynthesis protein B [Dehalogenimonas etheniformans]QNT75844.1 molybdopterin-guanine dinucleotide biosynthesis protein B [Dehalogenimonas etheniformans]
MPAPVIAFVGRSDSGKTTLLEKIIPELKSRGYRVATIKHVPGHLVEPAEERDTTRHLAAGSNTSVINSPEKLIFVKKQSSESTLLNIAWSLDEDFDIILAEGFKNSPVPKILVHRLEAGSPPESLNRVVAVVSDESVALDVRRFGLEDVSAIADFLVETVINPSRSRVDLRVNGERVALSNYPAEIIAAVMETMAKTLKGVAGVKDLEFRLKKP